MIIINKMLPLLDSFVEPDFDSTLLLFLNTIISLHLFALVAYFLLLAKDLIKGTDSAYPYKQTEAAMRKKQA